MKNFSFCVICFEIQFFVSIQFGPLLVLVIAASQIRRQNHLKKFDDVSCFALMHLLSFCLPSFTCSSCQLRGVSPHGFALGNSNIHELCTSCCICQELRFPSTSSDIQDPRQVSVREITNYSCPLINNVNPSPFDFLTASSNITYVI